MLQLDPTQARYLSDFGLLAVREGQVQEGLAALRQAHELAADDPTVLAKLTEGLCQTGAWDEANDPARWAASATPAAMRCGSSGMSFSSSNVEPNKRPPGSRLANSPDEEPHLLPFVRRRKGGPRGLAAESCAAIGQGGAANLISRRGFRVRNTLNQWPLAAWHSEADGYWPHPRFASAKPQVAANSVPSAKPQVAMCLHTLPIDKLPQHLRQNTDVARERCRLP